MRNNNVLRTLAAVSAIGLSLPTIALGDCSGFYLGAQAGYTRAHYDLDAFLSKDFKKDAFAGRAYLGYQFNQYMGFETGFAMLAGTELPKDFGDVKTTHWDLLLKVGAPFGDSGFRGDIKGGGVHVRSKFDASNIAKSVGLEDVQNWKIRPVAGGSLTYNFNKNIAIDATYFHVFGDPEGSSLGTPTVDLAMVGISLLFTS